MSGTTTPLTAEQAASLEALRRIGSQGTSTTVINDIANAANSDPVSFTRILRSLTWKVTELYDSRG